MADQQEIEEFDIDPESKQRDVDLAGLLEDLNEDEETKKEPETGEKTAEPTVEEKAAIKVYKGLGALELMLKKKYPFLVLETVVGEEDGEPVSAPMKDVLTGVYTPIAVDLGLGETGELPAWLEKTFGYGLAAYVTYECASAIREQVKYHKAKEIQKEGGQPEESAPEPKQQPQEEPEQVASESHPDMSVMAAQPIGG